MSTPPSAPPPGSTGGSPPGRGGSDTRRLLSKAYGLAYEPLESLERAAQQDDGVVVLEGDDGGQIYLVCPARMVQCDEPALRQLLADLDALAWPHGASGETRLCYERYPEGSIVPGGLGGGHVTGEVWLHDTFERMGLGDAIRDVVAGRRKGLRLTGA